MPKFDPARRTVVLTSGSGELIQASAILLSDGIVRIAWEGLGASTPSLQQNVALQPQPGCPKGLGESFQVQAQTQRSEPQTSLAPQGPGGVLLVLDGDLEAEP